MERPARPFLFFQQVIYSDIEVESFILIDLFEGGGVE